MATETPVLIHETPPTPDWLSSLRTASVARYGQLGLPRPKTEAWKFTNLNALKALEPAPAPVREVALPDLPVGLSDLDAARIILVDGRVVDHDPMPDGVEAVGLGSDAPAWVTSTP